MNLKNRNDRARAAAWLHTTVLALAAAAGALSYPLATRAAPADGMSAPDFALKQLGGGNLRLSEYRGDVVVLTFWASWCGACRATLADLNTLHDSISDDETVVLAVNIDGDARLAAGVVESLKLPYPNLADSKQTVGRLYDVEQLPLTLLLDRDGVVRGSWNKQPGLAHLIAGRITEIIDQ